jgi:hypothetical protein
VADTERDLADCGGAIYEAATHSGSLLDVGQRICRLLDAQRVTLRLGHSQAEARNVLMRPDESDVIYMARFHALSPHIAWAQRDFSEARVQHLRRVQVGTDIVPDAIFLRSEYYADFARHYERRHMVGVGDAMPVGVFSTEGTRPSATRSGCCRRFFRICRTHSSCVRARRTTRCPSAWPWSMPG